MRICQNELLDKFMLLLFIRSSTLRILTYGAIEIYAVQIYTTSFGAYRSITTLWGFSAFIVD